MEKSVRMWLSGPEVASYEEIKKQIRDFLYSQMEEDQAISSCIIIHTCNKNKEKVCYLDDSTLIILVFTLLLNIIQL